jgi:outer membrane protein assembly factor BamC
MQVVRNVLTGFILVVLLGGCSSLKKTVDEVLPDEKKVDYKKAKTGNTLEIPPDLTSSTIDSDLVVPELDPSSAGAASLSDYTSERSPGRVVRSSTVLPKQEDIQIMRDGKTRWLVLKGTPDEVWPTLREFWLQTGFLIKKENPGIGILETDWNENREDIADDFIRSTLKKSFLDSLYSAATRDKFRVRLERGQEQGTTEVYLTHYGAEEVVEGSTSTTVWKPRPQDPELEIEMLRRMAVYFGVDEKKSRSIIAARNGNKVERAKLLRDGKKTELRLYDDFPRAWRRTGLALDRIGFTVEDRDRSRGIYYVKYLDPLKDANTEKGWLDKFKFWGDDDKPSTDTYQINLRDVAGSGTEVTVLNKEGNVEQSKTAYRILTLLHEQLK